MVALGRQAPAALGYYFSGFLGPFSFVWFHFLTLEAFGWALGLSPDVEADRCPLVFWSCHFRGLG